VPTDRHPSTYARLMYSKQGAGLVVNVNKTEVSSSASYRAKEVKPPVFAPAASEFLCKVINYFKE